MENPPPATPAGPETAPTPSAGPETAPTPSAGPETAPAPTAPPVAPTPGSAASSPAVEPTPSGRAMRPPPDKVRTNLKIAGIAMIVIGAMTALQAFTIYSQVTHVLTDDEVKQFADVAGGNISVDFASASAASPATFTLEDFNGTQLSTTTMTGHLDAPAGKAAVRATIVWNNSTWVRKVIAPPGYPAVLRLDAQSPATSDAWVQPDPSPVLPWVWGGMAVGLFIVVTGIFTFLLRAPRLALAGAVAFLLGGIALTWTAYSGSGANLGVLLQPLLFVAMGGFCIWAVRKGWSRFAPLAIGPIQL